VLSLFLLSVIPAGLAEEGSNNMVDVEVDAEAEVNSNSGEGSADAEVKTESETEVGTEDQDSGVEEETEVKSEVKDSETEEKVEVKTKVRNGLLKQEVKHEVKLLKNARERLEDAKERFHEAKEKQREHREKVLELHKKARRCNAENEDCAALKLELRLGVKNHLLKSVQVVERSLEKLTKTVEKMEDLSEEEKQNALDLIADFEAELDAQKAKIDSFTNETSQEEIRAAIKDLKELNQKVHKLQRRLVGLLVNAKLHVLVGKHEDLHTSMQARIDAAAEAGADVSELEAILAEFDAKVAELEQDYEAAKQKWMEAKDAEDFDLFNRELRAAQHAVRKDLQETKKILRNFLAEYKEVQQDLSETEDASEESENEGEGSEDSEESESNTAVEADANAEATA